MARPALGGPAIRGAVGLLLVAGLAALALRAIDPRQLASALARADGRLLVVAALFNLTINVASRTLRWWSLLRAVPGCPGRLPLGALARLVLAGAAAANLLPGRGGEVVRTYGAHRLLGIAVGESAAVLLVEAVVEVASFAVVSLPLAAGLGPPLPPSVRPYLVALCAGVALLLSLLWWAARRRGGAQEQDRKAAEAEPAARRWHHAPRRWLRRQWAAGGKVWPLLLAPRSFGQSLLCSTWNAVNDAIMLGLCMHAVGVVLPVASWFLVLLALNVAIAIPATPGQIGMMELGAVLALKALGVPPDDALAVALLYHGCHLVPLSSVGLIEVVRMGAVGVSR